ncbi:MAG: tail fiber domain-containing protein [Terracidiphilus sp.]
MKNIRTAILAVFIGTLGSLALQAQWGDVYYGYGALQSDDSFNNSAFGAYALGNLTTGNNNSAVGAYALRSVVSGSNNSAFGYNALYNNYNGSENSAYGVYALYSSVNGNTNTAFGYDALGDLVKGEDNIAVGPWALNGDPDTGNTGSENVAVGDMAIYQNTTGQLNTSIGNYALDHNTTGSYNAALGSGALSAITTGSNNIAIGYEAGNKLSTDTSNNIDIGSQGSASDHNNTIRIGNGTHTAFYAAGVNTEDTDSEGTPVYIDNYGKLGTRKSSIRFKEDVHDMAAASDGLMRLRPVTYRYKKPYADGSKPIDYGLIAEEVAEVYPDLVIRDADGQIQTVQYQKLTPMLLNEMQKQHRLLEEQAKTIQQLEKQLAALPLLEKRLAALEAAQPSTTLLESRLEKK